MLQIVGAVAAYFVTMVQLIGLFFSANNVSPVLP
jgi:hypothetical protein